MSVENPGDGAWYELNFLGDFVLILDKDVEVGVYSTYYFADHDNDGTFELDVDREVVVKNYDKYYRMTDKKTFAYLTNLKDIPQRVGDFSAVTPSGLIYRIEAYNKPYSFDSVRIFIDTNDYAYMEVVNTKHPDASPVRFFTGVEGSEKLSFRDSRTLPI